MDRILVLEERTHRVATKVTELLKEGGDRYAKTIVFCEDIAHAERMRQGLVNANRDIAATHHRYVMRITGDSPEGKAQLDNFIDPDQTYPVIVTTSRLLSTGVDVQTCKLIVLDRRIRSVSEFKQIIGRGTRVNEDYDKTWFTVLDFKKATELFADPDFDGEPVAVYVPDEGGNILPPEGSELEEEGSEEEIALGPGWPEVAPQSGAIRYYVSGVPVSVLAERVQYLDKDGKLITESLRDYARQAVRDRFSSLDRFLREWRAAERKDAIVEELEERGVFFKELERAVGGEYSPFDLVCHVAFDRPPKTRAERAQSVRASGYFGEYEGVARAVLEALLEKYADEAVDDLQHPGILELSRLSDMGSPIELARVFGGADDYRSAVRHLVERIYDAA